MNIDELIAIDVHTHAEVSCRQPHDEVWQPYDEAASKYFKVGSARPSPRPSPTTASARSASSCSPSIRSPDRGRRISNEEVVGRGAREFRHHDRVRQHRSAQGQAWVCARRAADRRRRDPRLQVPPDRAGFLSQRPHGLSALRGDRRAQAACHLPQRTFRHRHRDARRRRAAPQVFQPDAYR